MPDKTLSWAGVIFMIVGAIGIALSIIIPVTSTTIIWKDAISYGMSFLIIFGLGWLMHFIASKY